MCFACEELYVKILSASAATSVRIIEQNNPRKARYKSPKIMQNFSITINVNLVPQASRGSERNNRVNDNRASRGKGGWQPYYSRPKKVYTCWDDCPEYPYSSRSITQAAERAEISRSTLSQMLNRAKRRGKHEVYSPKAECWFSFEPFKEGAHVTKEITDEWE